MAAPAYISAGVFQKGSGALSVAWGTHQQGDMGLLVVGTANQSIATPGGWTLIGSSTRGTAGAAGGVAVYAYYRFAASNAESVVAVPDSGSYTTAQIFAFRGLSQSLPVAAQAASNQAATTAISLPSVTTTRGGCQVVHIVGIDDDFNDTSNVSGWSNAALSSLTEIGDQTVNTGAGGGFSVATGYMPVAGVLGSTTATGDFSTAMAHLTIAFGPDQDLEGEGAYVNVNAEGSISTGVTLAANVEVPLAAVAPAPTLTVVVPITLFANLAATVTAGGLGGTAELSTAITMAGAVDAALSVLAALDVQTGFLGSPVVTVGATGTLTTVIPLGGTAALVVASSGAVDGYASLAAVVSVIGGSGEAQLATEVTFATVVEVAAAARSATIWEATTLGTYATCLVSGEGWLDTFITPASAVGVGLTAVGALDAPTTFAAAVQLALAAASDLATEIQFAAAPVVQTQTQALISAAIEFAGAGVVNAAAAGALTTGVRLAVAAPVVVSASGEIQTLLELAAAVAAQVTAVGYIGVRVPEADVRASSDYIVRVPKELWLIHIPPELAYIRVPREYQPEPFERPTARPVAFLGGEALVQVTVRAPLTIYRRISGGAEVTVTASANSGSIGALGALVVVTVAASMTPTTEIAAAVEVVTLAEGTLVVELPGWLLLEDGELTLLEDGTTIGEG